MSSMPLTYPVEPDQAPRLSYGSQCVDLGVLYAQGYRPTVEDIMLRYRLTLAAAYRRYHLLAPKFHPAESLPWQPSQKPSTRPASFGKKSEIGSFTSAISPDTVVEKETEPCN